MGQVTLRVGGFSHPVSCEDGQESHLVGLGAEVDRRIASIRQMGGAQFPAAYRGDWKPLRGTANQWRLRVGDWRAICEWRNAERVLLVLSRPCGVTWRMCGPIRGRRTCHPGAGPRGCCSEIRSRGSFPMA